MNTSQMQLPLRTSTRDTRQRAERKRPGAEMKESGIVRCPLCQREWMSPDRKKVKFCKSCRMKVPVIEMSSVVEDQFIYF